MILSILTSWWFIVNTLMGIVLIEYALYKTRAQRKVDEVRDSKYPAFRRTDVQYWSRPRLYLAAPFIVTRCIIGFSQPPLFILCYRIITLFNKRGQKLSPLQFKLTQFIGKMNVRFVIMAGAGILKYDYQRPKVDYTKYFGPDWKPTYEGASTVIGNHSSWIDIMFIVIFKYPSFTPKMGIKHWPIVGTICEVLNSFFVSRAGTAEERKQVALAISNRQKEIEESNGKLPPLQMNPEGCTTNNTMLIQFRKGPFMGEYSIQPFTFKYYSPYFNLSHDTLDMMAHFFLSVSQFYATCTIKELPVFKPNEYFFKHHQQPGEERWHTYMRIVRQEMAEHLGVPLSDQTLEDKLAYKDLLYPKRGDKNKFE